MRARLSSLSSFGSFLPLGVVVGADLGGDGEAGGDGQADVVISARLAPLPPSRFFISLPSALLPPKKNVRFATFPAFFKMAVLALTLIPFLWPFLWPFLSVTFLVFSDLDLFLARLGMGAYLPCPGSQGRLFAGENASPGGAWSVDAGRLGRGARLGVQSRPCGRVSGSFWSWRRLPQRVAAVRCNPRARPARAVARGQAQRPGPGPGASGEPPGRPGRRTPPRAPRSPLRPAS